jgi:hypothetical protein
MAKAEDNPYRSPQPPADDENSQTGRPAHYMSPAPVEPGEGDHPFSSMRGLAVRGYFAIAMGLVGIYAAISEFYPMLGAAIGATLFVIGFGLLTTKVVLRIESPWKLWCLTPICGLGELLLLWLLFRLGAFLA